MHYSGDAVIAKFGAAVDAVSSATDIQRQLGIRNADLPDQRKVQFRIGVNLRDVIELVVL
jgi:adenylate cyclase